MALGHDKTASTKPQQRIAPTQMPVIPAKAGMTDLFGGLKIA